MVEIESITKTFGKIKAVDDVSCHIEKGSVFGLVGSNGAGKSTLLRLVSGVYRQDKGNISVNGQNVFDNPISKKELVFIGDTPYFAAGVNMDSAAGAYNSFYETFSYIEFERLVNLFNIDPKAPLSSFSKGMRRQAVIILALSAMCGLIIMDETLDGLDPVMRGLAKKLLYQRVADNNATVILSSHSLRELEDACDNLAMIHSGKIIFQRDIQNISSTVSKVQVVMEGDLKKQDFADIDVLNYTRKGSVANLIVRGGCEKVLEVLEKKEPMLLEVLPLTLEEVFTYELKQKGYSFDEILENGGTQYEK